MHPPRMMRTAWLWTMASLFLILSIVNQASALACTPPTPGMVSWWPGEGNANDIVGPNNGTLEGATTFAAGKVGQAFSSNGVNGDGGVNLGNVPEFDFTPTSSFTIEAWVNSFGPTAPPQDAQSIVMLNYQCSNTYQGLTIVNSTAKATFGVRDNNGAGVFIYSPSALASNTFHHIAGVREVTDAGKTLKLYVDGVLAATAADPSTGPLARNTPDFIAKRFPCADTNTFNGLIDEPAVYNRALSASEILAIANAGSAGKCTPQQQVDPIGYWPFDGSGADASGGGRNLDLAGDVGFAGGLFDQALDLRNNGAQFATRSVDDAVFDFGANDFTVQVWVNFNNTVREQTLIEKFSGSGGPGWTLTKLDGNALHFYASPSAVLTSAPLAIPSGVWHQILLWKSGTRYQIIYDGNVVAEQSNSNPVPNTTMPLLIGKRNVFDGRNFAVDGRLDEVAIWPRALSDAEIDLLFNDGDGSPASSLGETAPMATNDSYSTNEDTSLTVPAATGVLANDGDEDGDALTAVQVGGPSHGTLALNADGSFSYTPAADYNGPDTFTYQANDGSADSNVATVSLTVNAVNDAPVANDDTASTEEDTPIVVFVVGNDRDADGDTLTPSIVTGPRNGQVVVNGNGTITYTPDANFNGTDSATYRVGDGTAVSNTATVTITVNAVNDAPVAQNNSYSTNEDTALTIAAPGVLANDSDADGDPLAAILVSGPSHGSVTLNTNGAFSYTPAANYNGPDSFSYKANDGRADSNTATAAITVIPVDDFPANGVLDNFNRAGVKVGSNWEGLTDTAFYKITTNQLDVQAGGTLVWKPTAFGANQEAFVKLSKIDPKSPSQGVLLKVQAGSIPQSGAISVVYDAVVKAVRVSTLRVGVPAWTLYPNRVAAFSNGDVLGARALANGTVEIYRNGTRLTTVTLKAEDKTFFNAKGGKIGIWTAAAPAAIFDDFGGGTVTP